MPEPIDQFATTAHNLVDTVIESALRKLEDENKIRKQAIAAIRLDLSRSASAEPPPPVVHENYEVENIEWLTIEEFSIEKAEKKINDFIKVSLFRL